MHLVTLQNVREACRQTGKLCAILLDTKGPEIRTGKLKTGSTVQLTVGSAAGHMQATCGCSQRSTLQCPTLN